tara:strand:+ start:491 stop:805 length:315 start_codon:yes stop_codon:yes gene_type:complete
MNRDEIKKLIKEAFTEKAYGQYPYSHKGGEGDEPAEDYQVEWDQFSLDILEDRTRQGAVQLAKILVKEFEILTFVLDAVGKDQSLGSEILRKMQQESSKSDKQA